LSLVVPTAQIISSNSLDAPAQGDPARLSGPSASQPARTTTLDSLRRFRLRPFQNAANRVVTITAKLNADTDIFVQELCCHPFLTSHSI